MSSLTVYAPKITILDTAVSMLDGLYSLNDLHTASGKNKKHQPSFFMRNQETKDLVKEIEGMDKIKAVRKVQGGNNKTAQGTYVCKDLVYRYAMWISPKFALMVIRTFDKLVTGELQVQPSQLSTAEDRKPLVNAVNMHCNKSGAIYSDIWKMIHQRFNVDAVGQLTVEQVPQAVECIHNYSLKATTPPTPLSEFTHSQYITNVKQDVMDYVYSLQKAVISSGNNLPKYPDFDKEEICQSFIASMVQHNRMIMSFSHDGKPTMSFIPNDTMMIHRDNIADVAEFADKKQLPNIINAAVKRLGS